MAYSVLLLGVILADLPERLPPVHPAESVRELAGSIQRLPEIAPSASQPFLFIPPEPMPGAGELPVVARHAQMLIDRGFELARRRAYYSARAEFLLALEMFSQSIDLQTNSTRHSTSLTGALRALTEADDFLSRGSRLSADIDLAGIVASHRTGVLKEHGNQFVTPLIARQQYYTFAQQQLAAAAGHHAVASRALMGLGRVYDVLGKTSVRDHLRNAPKAMAALQAAVDVDGNNFLAANELAVLMARFGRLENARTLLQRSVALSPQPENWRNLAKVHLQLGEVELASIADAESRRARSVAPVQATSQVTWVSPAEFARMSHPHAAARETATGVRRCQAIAPVSPRVARHALHRAASSRPPRPSAVDQRSSLASSWNLLEQGEYIGPARTRHVPEYRLRIDDRMEFIYRLTRNEINGPYRLNVGDVVAVESLNDKEMNRGDVPEGKGLVIQPDGTITLHILGQIRAAGLTVEELRQEIVAGYRDYYKDPQITVTPVQVNTRLEDLRAAIDSRFGVGGQTRTARITPEGTISLPAIGSVPAQGLTLDEMKQEVEERYAGVVDGIEVTPVLTERAARYVYVLGEVPNSGRFTMEGPTSVMQAIAMSGGWNIGGNLRQIVIFRRSADWRLMATLLNVQDALLGRQTCPLNEIWLRDSDLVLVPKSTIQVVDDFVELVFRRGIYGVLPINFGADFGRISSL